MNRWPAVIALLLLAACSAPSPSGTAPPTVPDELIVMTHDSFAVSDDVRVEFEQQHGVSVHVLKAGDAGRMVNQAILARNAPLADLLYGVDNTFLSRALAAAIFDPYQSAALATVPAELQLDPQFRVTPIDYADVCLNYDRAAFSAELPAPATLDDLLDERYAGQLVVENPATSSPGLAFLLATYDRFGESGGFTWRDYWAGLRDNDVRVESGWEQAYNGAFSGGSGAGDRPIVVSYATSPAVEVLFAASPAPGESPAGAPTGVVTDGCFRQVEFAALLAGARAEARPVAQAWIDFMLSRRFQEDMPLQMFVMPANREAQLPEVFTATVPVIGNPVALTPAEIDQVRERLIGEWTDVVLR